MATESNSQDQQAADTQRTERDRAYWRANLRLMAVLLSLWFITSFGFGILLVEWLNQFQFFGFPLGFWWAQQGSIYVFIVLIFVYAAAMRRLDRQYDVDEERT